MKGRLSRDRILSVVPILFALSASVSLFIHLEGLMSASRFPPGEGATLHYKAIAHGSDAGSLLPREAILHSLISITKYVSDTDLLTAIKLTSMLIAGLLPLSTYVLASTVTESNLIGIISAWLAAFIPAATAPIMIGNYGLTLGLVFFVAYLAFLVRCLKKSSMRTLFLALLWEAVAVLGDVNSTLIIIPVITAFSFFALRHREDIALQRLLFLSVVFVALPSLVLSAFSSPFQAQSPTFSVDPSLWAEDLWLTLTLAICAVAGIYTLLRRVGSIVLSVLIVSASVPLASTFTPFLSSFHVFSVPILAVLAASPLLWLRESVSVNELESEESSPNAEIEESPVVDVVIDLPRFTPVLLVIILTVSTLGVGYGTSARVYDRNSFSGYFTYEEVTSAAEWISRNTPAESVFSAKPEVAAWLEAFSGRRVIGFGGENESLIPETIESTSFRILTPSLLVDEWEPFSTLKAPLISYYNGEEYSQIAYIDDSLSGVKVTKDGRKRTERLFRSAYGGYRWLSNSPPQVILVQYFETSDLFFEKTIKVSVKEPRLKVKYRVDPKPEAELVSFDLFIRIQPSEKMKTLNTTADEIVLAVGGKEVKISFSGNIVNLRYDEYDEQLAISMAEFEPVNGALEAEVVISIKSEDRSQRPLWVAHTPDLIRSHDIGYVVAKSGREDLLDRMLVKPIQYLSIKDSFNKVISEQDGNVCVEAPYEGEVLFDKSLADDMRLVGYETDCLLVNKTLISTERSVEIRYALAPKKSRSSLISMNLTVWIGWDIPLVDHTVTVDTVRMKLGYGELEVRFIGNPVYIEVGPDPESGQNRVQAVLALQGDGDEVGVNISMLKPLLFEYEVVSGPQTEADDQLTIYVNPSMFIEVFKRERLMVCRVAPWLGELEHS